MLGRYGDQGVEVLNGLKEGEYVVVRGTFLLDAESRIQGGGGGGGHHH
jgi:Cu(I)/Ag(I) efflux system membrane fusion protein